MTDLTWKLRQRRTVYQHEPWLKVHADTVELPDGRLVEDYHRVDMTDFAIAAAETGDGKFIVIRQFKMGVGAVSLTLPGGMIDPGESPVQAAQRELLEETGYIAEEWAPLHRIVLHGNHRCCEGHIFYARNARLVATPQSGDLEEMEFLLLDRTQIRQALARNEFVLAGTASAMAFILAGINVGGD